MANRNPKNQIKSSEQARAMGKKSKRGISIKRAMKEFFLAESKKKNSEFSEKEFVKSIVKNGMEGNAGMVKILMEYIDGKVKDELEITERKVLTFEEKASKKK